MNGPPPGETPEAGWDDHRRAFGDMLGLGGPVPDAALRAALYDGTYAQSLFAAREGDPRHLRRLLDEPPEVEEIAEKSPQARQAKLVRRAAKALALWASDLFATVDDETLRRRRDACAACEHATRPPDLLLYRLAGGLEQTICELCGCNLVQKTRFPEASCPALHPRLPGMTRWGEPIGGT